MLTVPCGQVRQNYCCVVVVFVVLRVPGMCTFLGFWPVWLRRPGRRLRRQPATDACSARLSTGSDTLHPFTAALYYTIASQACSQLYLHYTHRFRQDPSAFILIQFCLLFLQSSEHSYLTIEDVRIFPKFLILLYFPKQNCLVDQLFHKLIYFFTNPKYFLHN